MYDGFTPVLFVTLTEKNGRDDIKMMEETSLFLHRLAHKTKTHPLIHRGGDYDQNLHEHICICVPDSELDRFSDRKKKFIPWANWRFRTLDFQEWDFSKGNGAFVYTSNHSQFPTEVICPKQYRSCRNGNCQHQHQDFRRIVNLAAL
jgi:hypothetical protein